MIKSLSFHPKPKKNKLFILNIVIKQKEEMKKYIKTNNLQNLSKTIKTLYNSFNNFLPILLQSNTMDTYNSHWVQLTNTRVLFTWKLLFLLNPCVFVYLSFIILTVASTAISTALLDQDLQCNLNCGCQQPYLSCLVF